MITVRGCFTQEANQEAERIANSPNNVLNIYGQNNRQVSMECVQTIYDLTCA
jgi:hypothetical protein